MTRAAERAGGDRERARAAAVAAERAGRIRYAAGVWLVFHVFVVLYEEPTLRRQFGQSYVAYRESVRRWIPRRRGTG